MSLRIILISLFLLAFPAAAPALVYTVTTTADSGTGSLREAITNLNGAPGPHDVVFDIPAAECSSEGICKFFLLSLLDEIAEPVMIDGTTQPRYGSAPANVCANSGVPSYMRIEIKGISGTGSYVFALDPAGAPGASTFQGLALYGSSNSIAITTAGAHRVQCNHIGADGTGDPVTWISSNSVVLHFAAAGAIIGTDGDGQNDLAERNVFVDGTHLVNVNSNSDNRISGNYFGLSADGLTQQGDCSRAIFIRQSSARNIVGTDGDGVSDELERNVIACRTGVLLATFPISGEDNEVVGNWIGLTADGSPAAGQIGVYLTPSNLPGGGPQYVARNRIENQVEGIVVTHSMEIDAASAENCLLNNVDGFVHEGDAALVFEDNWWGAADGPSGAGAGSGDSVLLTGSGTLDFSPWSSADPCPVPEPASGALLAGLALLAVLHRRGARSGES